MSNLRSLTELKKLSPEATEKLIGSLRSSSKRESEEAGLSLARDAASFGISVRDYLKLAVGRESNSAESLDGYELMLEKLNLPFRNDFSNGVHLQAASETFQTYPGTRALFPEVIDDVLRFATRQNIRESVEPLLANSRTVAGVELLSTVINDDSKDRDSFVVSEMGRIPVRTIKTSEKSVKFYKHGSAIRTSYEFSRRASLDLLVPYANRVARELELSKLTVATSVLLNGDGAYGAAPSVNQSSYNDETGVTATDGKINWPHFVYWLIQRSKDKNPIDTVVMNWDGWFQWLMMFGEQSSTAGSTAVEKLSAMGVTVDRMPAAMQMIMNITPVLSSAMPAGKLLGLIKGETLEELKESGSDIQETERAILNQTMTMVRTENTGYRLVYGDTRSVFVFDEP